VMRLDCCEILILLINHLSLQIEEARSLARRREFIGSMGRITAAALVGLPTSLNRKP
jgi:hypothetical protein